MGKRDKESIAEGSRQRIVCMVGAKTLFDTHPLPDHYPMTSVVVNLYKAIFYFGDFSVMGMKHGPLEKPIFGPDAKRVLCDVPMFIYHVPDDPGLLNSLAHTHNVMTFILEDHRLNRYALSSCQ